MRLSFRGRCAGVVAGVLLLVSCRDAASPGDALQDARARWAAKGTASYSLVIVRTCECLVANGLPVVVNVENGIVTSRFFLLTSQPVPTEVQLSFPDVPGLFAIVENARDAGAHQLIVRYHETLGFPASITIDYDENVADDELAYSVDMIGQ